METAAERIDARVRELGDWRGAMLARVRAVVLEADPEIVEEWKWRGVPVWSRGGIVCTGETYKSVVKLTFAKGAALPDPAGLFNSSLEGNVRRAIDLREGEALDEAALGELVRAAVAGNLAESGRARVLCRLVATRRTLRTGAGKAEGKGQRVDWGGRTCLEIVDSEG